MAIILPQTVKIKWLSSNKKRYINKGYTFTNIDDEFEVNVLDLPKSSQIKVWCKCDICGKKVQKSFHAANPDKKTRNKSQKLICCFDYKCVVEKTKQVNIERYGKPSAMQNNKIKQHQKDTNKRKYGVENVFQDKKIRQKAEDTMLEKYNVKYAIQNKNSSQKRKQSLHDNCTGACSKPQKYIFNLLNINNNYELNYPCIYYLLDIVDMQNKIDIEYDGGGHNLPVKFGYITQKEFNNKDIKRNFFVQKQGYKVLRIISDNDKLPKDDILLSLINECTNYLKYTNYTWIYIDLNKQKIISHAFNKNI